MFCATFYIVWVSDVVTATANDSSFEHGLIIKNILGFIAQFSIAELYAWLHKVIMFLYFLQKFIIYETEIHHNIYRKDMNIR